MKIALVLLILGAAASTITCFKVRERAAGVDKVCFYDCRRVPTSIIISGDETCPLIIEKPKNNPHT